MAKVWIERVMDWLGDDLREALRKSLEHHYPNRTHDVAAVYTTFLKEAHRQCALFESVPDKYVEADD